MIILRFLLSAFVLWVGSILSPETIIFTDTKALIVTTLLLYGVELLIGMLYTGILCVTTIVNTLMCNKLIALKAIVYSIVIILTIVLALTLHILSVYIVSKYYAGFEVTDTYHMVFLAIALSATSIDTKNSKEDT